MLKHAILSFSICLNASHHHKNIDIITVLKHAILCYIPDICEPDEDEMQMQSRDSPSSSCAQRLVHDSPLREALCPVWVRAATASSDAASSDLHVLRLLCIYLCVIDCKRICVFRLIRGLRPEKLPMMTRIQFY